MLRVAILVGSLRQDSLNLALAKEAREILSSKADVDLIIPDLPLFSADFEEKDAEPSLKEAEELRRRLREADALLVCSPEYDGLPTAVTLNALHWASRPPLPSLEGTPTVIAGVSSGLRGTRDSRPALELALKRVGARVVGDGIFVARGKETFDSEEDLDLLKGELQEKLSLLLLSKEESLQG